jgi:RNA polymerase sigma-70 factor, ECF subfamily
MTMPTEDGSRSEDREWSELEFSELVRRSQRGDRRALSYLVSQCREYLLLIANEDLDEALQGKFGASDFVQQTLLVAQQKLDQFRGQTPAEWKGWLRQILRNDLNRARREFIENQGRAVKRERAIDDSQCQPFLLPDLANTPGTDAVVREEARLLKSALEKLPQNYQLALQLREWEDLSYPEIGQRMGISEEAARKLCRRAIDRLEQILKPAIRGDESNLILKPDTDNHPGQSMD